jgi:hypothetical protein
MLVQLQHCLGDAFRFLSEHPAQQAGTPLLLLPRISRNVFMHPGFVSEKKGYTFFL